MRLAVFLLVISIHLSLYIMKDFQHEARKLEITISELQEEKKVYWKNKTLVCDTEEGDIVRIDCGEAFAQSAAICICTTSCLEDFSMVISNSAPEDCDFRHAQDEEEIF
jgi:hypothetical protein